MTDKFTLSDIGCYVDNTRGVYMINMIYKFAYQLGFRDTAKCGCTYCKNRPIALINNYTPSKCEMNNELEDDIDSYMNDKHGVEGAQWGRNSDTSDWGLWPE